MNRASSPTGWVRNPDGTLGYTWNPFTGCLNGCEYCYARKLANGRLRARYLANKNVAPFIATPNKKAPYLYEQNPFYPRLWLERLEQPFSIKGSAGIFPCDMSDLFGIGIPYEWTEAVMNVIKIADRHRFYLLTKQPQNLIKFSPFPENCWVGMTCDTAQRLYDSWDKMFLVKAKVKFISFEPLLERMEGNLDNIFAYAGINWVIIGAQTKPSNEDIFACGLADPSRLMKWGRMWTIQPKIEWVEEIVQACDKAGIPVFLKDNLKPLLRNEQGWTPAIYVSARSCSGEEWLRQEVPE